jgi:hypothetical protein
VPVEQPSPLIEIDPSALPVTRRFRGVGLAIVYGLSTTRNAWHGRRSHRRKQSWLFARFDDATHHAEFKRTQGSRFHIREIPALALRHDHGVIYVIEPWSDRPLSAMLRSIPDQIDLKGVVEWALTSLGADGVVCASAAIDIGGLVIPIRTMTSRSHGQGFKLGWHGWLADTDPVDVGPLETLRDVIASRLIP